MTFPLRERLEAHAVECRKALDDFRARPSLPQDIADELWRLIVAGDRASLVGASLDGASLVGARLDGARLDRARLDGASLDRARLDGASLVGASLDGASLDRARLVGARLDRASLVGASGQRFELVNGEARTIAGGRYAALTVPTKTGRVLRFGCETRLLTDWRENVAALCTKHEPDHAAKFEVEIRAIMAYCESLDAAKTEAVTS